MKTIDAALHSRVTHPLMVSVNVRGPENECPFHLDEVCVLDKQDFCGPGWPTWCPLLKFRAVIVTAVDEP